MRKSALVIGITLAAALSGFAPGVHARDDGRYSDFPGNIRDWFGALRNPLTGKPCCDDSDCARTEARTRGGRWEARAPDGSWIAIPPEAMIVDQGNPTGEPILCSMPGEESWQVLCFVPGPGG